MVEHANRQRRAKFGLKWALRTRMGRICTAKSLKSKSFFRSCSPLVCVFLAPIKNKMFPVRLSRASHENAIFLLEINNLKAYQEASGANPFERRKDGAGACFSKV